MQWFHNAYPRVDFNFMSFFTFLHLILNLKRIPEVLTASVNGQMERLKNVSHIV